MVADQPPHRVDLAQKLAGRWELRVDERTVRYRLVRLRSGAEDGRRSQDEACASWGDEIAAWIAEQKGREGHPDPVRDLCVTWWRSARSCGRCRPPCLSRSRAWSTGRSRATASSPSRIAATRSVCLPGLRVCRRHASGRPCSQGLRCSPPRSVSPPRRPTPVTKRYGGSRACCPPSKRRSGGPRPVQSDPRPERQSGVIGDGGLSQATASSADRRAACSSTVCVAFSCLSGG